jgi:hypothetical protein
MRQIDDLQAARNANPSAHEDVWLMTEKAPSQGVLDYAAARGVKVVNILGNPWLGPP